MLPEAGWVTEGLMGAFKVETVHKFCDSFQPGEVNLVKMTRYCVMSPISQYEVCFLNKKLQYNANNCAPNWFALTSSVGSSSMVSSGW